MIMSLFVIVWASTVSVVAVVTRRITHETVLEGLVAFLVPFKVPNHFFLLYKNTRMTIQAMEMLSEIHLFQISFNYSLNLNAKWSVNIYTCN